VSGDTNTSTLSLTAETPETTAYGDNTRTRAASGLRDWNLSANCLFNDTATTGIETVLSGILGGSSMLKWGPAGSTSGNVSYTGCCIVSDYSIESPVEGMVTLSFTATARAGSMTRATF